MTHPLNYFLITIWYPLLIRMLFIILPFIVISFLLATILDDDVNTGMLNHYTLTTASILRNIDNPRIDNKGAAILAITYF